MGSWGDLLGRRERLSLYSIFAVFMDWSCILYKRKTSESVSLDTELFDSPKSVQTVLEVKPEALVVLQGLLVYFVGIFELTCKREHINLGLGQLVFQLLSIIFVSVLNG